jgi:DNA-binding response OmpR family regulator
MAVPDRKRVLLVDDDQVLTTSLGSFLEHAGYQVAAACNGHDALAQIESFRPHIILLDIQMPFMNGRECLRRLRQAGNWTPVIMLTIVDVTAEKTMALNEGADDYVSKPFDNHELVARIEAILRRARSEPATLEAAVQLASGPLRLDRRARVAYLDGRALPLSPKAVAVLDYLMLHRNKVLGREQLLRALWGLDADVATRVVDLRIAELRRALHDERTAPRFIATVPNMGYRFVGPVEVVP